MKFAFGKALRTARKARGMTQEDFSSVSSRTYLSTLERGRKSPTLDKVHLLAQSLGIHFLSLMTLSTLYKEEDSDIEELLLRIKLEVESFDDRRKIP